MPPAKRKRGNTKNNSNKQSKSTMVVGLPGRRRSSSSGKGSAASQDAILQMFAGYAGGMNKFAMVRYLIACLIICKHIAETVSYL